MKSYYKVWFSNGSERTAALVLDTEHWPLGKVSISQYSRLYSYKESPKMKKIHVSACYPSFEEAFAAKVDGD